MNRRRTATFRSFARMRHPNSGDQIAQNLKNFSLLLSRRQCIRLIGPVTNLLYVLKQHLLTEAVLKLCRPAMGVNEVPVQWSNE